LNIHFIKENIKTVNKHMKRCSLSLVIREMQIKTIMIYHFTATGMAITEKIFKENKCWQGYGATGILLYHCKMV